MGVVPSGTLPTELESSGLVTMRTAAILTGSYVASTNDFFIGNYNQVTLFFTLTKASVTSVEYYMVFSQDATNPATNWFKSTNKAVAGSTTIVTLSDPIKIVTAPLAASELFLKTNKCAPAWLRLYVKGTAADFTASSLGIQAVANFV